MNSNAVHNGLNIAGLVLGLATFALLYTGCTELVTGQIECSKSWLDARITAGLMMLIPPLKFGINIVRDGFGGLWKQQPPVR